MSHLKMNIFFRIRNKITEKTKIHFYKAEKNQVANLSSLAIFSVIPLHLREKFVFKTSKAYHVLILYSL